MAYCWLYRYFFWILCIGAAHRVKRSVEQNEPAVIHRTLLVFFILNALVSLAVYDPVSFGKPAPSIPYQYQGDYQKYFIGTGDYIKALVSILHHQRGDQRLRGSVFPGSGQIRVDALQHGDPPVNRAAISATWSCRALLCLFLFRSTRNQYDCYLAFPSLCSLVRISRTAAISTRCGEVQ